MPYLYLCPSWKYDFDCAVGATEFLRWRKDELRPVILEHNRRGRRGAKREHTVRTQFNIPAAYHRVVCQLVGEVYFANRHDLYEAQRRQVYAREVLDRFGQELMGLRRYSDQAMVAFRSKTLTPILMRQLWGVDDAYAPSVEGAVKRSHKSLTIQAATEFYLDDDPADPAFIPTYRRNILYVPMARWYLGRVMRIDDPKSGSVTKAPDYYKLFLNDHDIIMKSLKQTSFQGEDENGFPLLSEVEVSAITREGLSPFFAPEIKRLVSAFSMLCRLETDAKPKQESSQTPTQSGTSQSK